MPGENQAGRIVVAGGGSGGHAMPALAAVMPLRAEPAVEIEYIGSPTGIERELAVGAGVLPLGCTGKLRRAPRWYGLLTQRNATDVLRVVRGAFASFALCDRRSCSPRAGS